MRCLKLTLTILMVLPLMLLQSAVFIAGALAVTRVRVPPVTHTVEHTPALLAIREGLIATGKISKDSRI